MHLQSCRHLTKLLHWSCVLPMRSTLVCLCSSSVTLNHQISSQKVKVSMSRFSSTGGLLLWRRCQPRSRSHLTKRGGSKSSLVSNIHHQGLRTFSISFVVRSIWDKTCFFKTHILPDSCSCMLFEQLHSLLSSFQSTIRHIKTFWDPLDQWLT